MLWLAGGGSRTRRQLDDREGLVFTWENGSPVLGDYASKQFVRAQRDSGLPRLTLHEVRHTHASILLREGVPVHVVSARLGHKDASVTLNVYAHHIPEDHVAGWPLPRTDPGCVQPP